MAKKPARRFFSHQCSCCVATPIACDPPASVRSGLDRRRVLAGGAASLGLGALAATGFAGTTGSAQAQGAAGAVNKAARVIDVHHHLSPPTMIAELTSHKLGARPTFDWSPAKSIEDMDKAGVATSIVSVTTPGISSLWMGDGALARRVARESNEYAARLVKDHPGRFGMFAALPMPDVEGSLLEIEYALDTLKADGIGFLTSYGDKWLGDPAFTPIMDELNRRKALVFTHPTAANCCRNLVPDIPVATIEYGTDTSRTIASLVFSGTAARTRDIRFIFSHAGGTMPFLLERFTELPKLNKALASRVPDGVLYELKRFYYDTAQASHPGALSSLTRLVAFSQILFGTDFPFRTSEDHIKGLADYGFSAAELQMIEHDNAMKLLPQLKA